MCRPSSSRRRHTQLETIRGKLRAARPLLTQLRAADEVRDKAIKRHGLLNKEIIGLRLILEGKALELAEAATEVKKATQCVAEVQSKLTAIDLMQLEAAPRPAEVSPELTPIQIAVQLATALDPFTRASFEAWMASVPAGAVPVYMAAGDELMAGQAEQAAAAAAGAEAMTAAGVAMPALGAAFTPFRAARVRTDPYIQSKRRLENELDAKDDGRSRSGHSEPHDRSELSAVGSCRSANTGMGGSCRGLADRPVSQSVGYVHQEPAAAVCPRRWPEYSGHQFDEEWESLHRSLDLARRGASVHHVGELDHLRASCSIPGYRNMISRVAASTFCPFVCLDIGSLDIHLAARVALSMLSLGSLGLAAAMMLLWRPPVEAPPAPLRRCWLLRGPRCGASPMFLGRMSTSTVTARLRSSWLSLGQHSMTTRSSDKSWQASAWHCRPYAR